MPLRCRFKERVEQRNIKGDEDAERDGESIDPYKFTNQTFVLLYSLVEGCNEVRTTIFAFDTMTVKFRSNNCLELSKEMVLPQSSFRLC